MHYFIMGNSIVLLSRTDFSRTRTRTFYHGEFHCVVVKDWLLEDKDLGSEDDEEDKDLRSEDEDKDKDLDLRSKDEDKDSKFQMLKHLSNNDINFLE